VSGRPTEDAAERYALTRIAETCPTVTVAYEQVSVEGGGGPWTVSPAQRLSLRARDLPAVRTAHGKGKENPLLAYLNL
jgi:hypothetical protein